MIVLLRRLASENLFFYSKRKIARAARTASILLVLRKSPVWEATRL